MEMDLPLQLRKVGLVLAAFATAFIAHTVISTVTATAAEANEISCGAIQCNVTSRQYAAGTDSQTPPSTGGNNGGSNNGGGGGSAPRTVPVFTQCATWYGSESIVIDEPPYVFNAVTYYPDPEWPGSFTCRFEREMSDFPKNLSVCPQLGDGRRAYGVYDIHLVNEDGSRGAVWYSFCTYPAQRYVTPTVSTFTRPTGGEAWFYSTANAGTAQSYGSSGTLSDSTGYRSTGFSQSNPAADVRLDQTFNARTRLMNGLPVYGYYRLDWKVNWVEYERKQWPAFLNKGDTFTKLRDYTTTDAQPFTFACNLSPALQAGIVRGAVFDPAACNPSSWQCSVDGDIQVNGTARNQQVMRNGEHLTVTLPRFNVNGNGVRDVRDKQTYTAVDMRNVSPVNTQEAPRDPEHKKQYFAASWKWNRWVAYNPNDQWIAFYWSSDAGKHFEFSQRYRFTGEFLVNWQAGIGEGTTQRWVTDTVECGGTKHSPDIQVVRSVSSP